MMRRYLLLCLVLIVSICCSSQNTSKIIITSEQLKTANLIFVEHEKLTKSLPLFEERITNLELINKSWERTDSIRRAKLLYFDKLIKDKNRSIEDLNKSLKKKQKVIRYGAAGSCVLIIACLLLK